MPTFFHQSLLLRTSRTAARLMRKTFNEMLEHHSNFGDSPVTPYEMIRTAYSTTDKILFPLLLKMTSAQEAKPEIVEYHARVAHGYRVGAQREAWKLMIEVDPIKGPADVETFKTRNTKLYGAEQPTFDGLVNKYKAKGFASHEAVKEILKSAARTNKEYDSRMAVSSEKLGVIPLPTNTHEHPSELSNY